MAKVCLQRESSSTNRKLLHEAYTQRGQKLMAGGLYAEAAGVLRNALSLEPCKQESRNGTADCDNDRKTLLWLMFECGVRGKDLASAAGILDQLPDPDERKRVMKAFVEEAVTGGAPYDQYCDPAFREDPGRIRRAFAAYERGDDTTAGFELKGIGLTSPCADWKWLLLGLIALAKPDAARAQACWNRIEGDGKASSVARHLRSVVDGTAGPVDGREGSESATTAHSLFRSDLAERLEQVKHALDHEPPAEVLRRCRRVLACAVNAGERAAYGRRLARAVCPRLAASDDFVVDEFPSVFGRLPEDPLYARTAALAMEKEDNLEAGLIWYEFIRMIRDGMVEAIPRSLRPRALALVWQRIGDLHRREPPGRIAYACRRLSVPRVDLDSASCYRKSIQSFPADVVAHEKLLDTLRVRRKRKEAEQVAVSILDRWPHHTGALLHIAGACADRGAYRKALKFFDRVREIEPLNADVRRHRQGCFLSSARARLDKGKPKLAFRDLEQAEALLDSGRADPAHCCTLAALHWRASDPARAEALFARASEAATDPLALYLWMAMATVRENAPDDVCRRFDAALAEAWRGPATVGGAVSLAEVVCRTVDEGGSPVDLPQLQPATRYLERLPKRLDMTEDQYLVVLRCLDHVKGWKLLQRFAKRAVTAHPDHCLFPAYLALGLLRRRRRLPRSTRKLVGRAKERAMETGRLEEFENIFNPLLPFPGAISSMFHSLLKNLTEQEVIAILERMAAFDAPKPRPRRGPARKPARSDRFEQPWLFEDLAVVEEES